MTSADYPAAVLVAALRYAERGWAVFPLHTIVDAATGACSCGTTPCGDAGKHPRVRRGVREATKDKKQIRKWFGKGSELSNIGIATGELSGITVLDIDIGDGKLGAESWAEAIREIGEPETLRAMTGSGGAHVFFQYNSALKTASNVLGKGVDCRNDGGYVVAAPSLHRSGGVYEWIDFETPLAILPAALSQRKETRKRPKRDDMYQSKYTLEQVEGMLTFVPADDRDLWRNVGIILGREFDRVDAAWALYVAWASKWTGRKGRNHDDTMHECFYEISQQMGSGKELSIGTILKAALDGGYEKPESPRKGRPKKVPVMLAADYRDMLAFLEPDRRVGKAIRFALTGFKEDALAEASAWYKSWSGETAEWVAGDADDHAWLIATAVKSGWTPPAGHRLPPSDFAFVASGVGSFYHVPSLQPFTRLSLLAIAHGAALEEGGKILPPDVIIQRLTTCMTMHYAPGEPSIIRGAYAAEGELVFGGPSNVLNSYRAPKDWWPNGLPSLDEAKALAEPWLKHLRLMLPHEDSQNVSDADVLLGFLAHNVQKPGVQLKWMPLIYSTEQGTGKDMLLSVAVDAVGRANVAMIEPKHLMREFNPYVEKCLIRINELGDFGSERIDRFSLYKRVKSLVDGADSVRINQKYAAEREARPSANIVATTNHPDRALYIPPEDRRIEVMECASFEAMGLGFPAVRAEYFARVFSWCESEEGKRAVSALLRLWPLAATKVGGVRRDTDARRRLIERGEVSFDWLREILADLGGGPQRKDTVVRMAQLRLRKNSAKEAAAEVMAALHEAGYCTAPGGDEGGRHTFTDGKKTAVLVPRTHDGRSNRANWAGHDPKLKSPEEVEEQF